MPIRAMGYSLRCWTPPGIIATVGVSRRATGGIARAADIDGFHRLRQVVQLAEKGISDGGQSADDTDDQKRNQEDPLEAEDTTAGRRPTAIVEKTAHA